ncbi:CCXG family PEP-CTERM protein [Janthinobacterium agaricidamnosum]|uniref:PEP-CTERM putative exosortase interaction domain protein n=1 Tax=Janthinobacterium agaricidamnosum NBRC 102515 = DSM 9628 TaxID=1349767 RepID=W0V9D6_9BURK|nr:CCXG family PEP-CTERM protein [Janthinobacterium agaricidamnosum]CDG83938.1 PEP-CTERM putative exosortase interaction domain protein [Janthinobacterium agaricidamnosum NBRC 102515 = DSM 9628]
MKRTTTLSLAFAMMGSAVLVSSAAQASTITIQTANSNAAAQNSAAAYRSVVDAALASPAGAATSKTVAIYDNIASQSLLGGSLSSIAFKSTVDFGVSAANAGLWTIRSGVDFSKGGAIFVDGVAYGYSSSDMYWAGAYNTPGQYFNIALNLAAGNHTLNIYGLEACCGGLQQAQFKAGSSASFTTFSNTDNLVSPVPEPGIYAMLLIGMGLLAFSARRETRGRSDKFAAQGVRA